MNSEKLRSPDAGRKMQLYWSSRSPFVRKVMICAHECGVADLLHLKRVEVGSRKLDVELMRHCPINRIPTLILENGEPLYDSAVICSYLDHSFNQGRLSLPMGDRNYWMERRLEALGDGMMDFTTGRVAEKSREFPSDVRLEICARKLASAMDWLDEHAPNLNPSGLTIGQIAVASALCHLDFRDAGLNWRQGRDALKTWHRNICERDSVQKTAFEDTY